MITGDLKKGEQYDKIKKESKETCRAAYFECINDLFNTDGSNKHFWAYTKKRRRDSSGMAPLKDIPISILFLSEQIQQVFIWLQFYVQCRDLLALCTSLSETL